LLYKRQNRNQTNKTEWKLGQEEKIANQQQLQLKESYSLAKSPSTNTFFTDLLNNYAKKFAKNKKIDISRIPLSFGGFYYDKKINQDSRAMGISHLPSISQSSPQDTFKISLNQLYLLNKFGHDEYFTNYPKKYCFIDISFVQMMKICSHELAHYLQFVKNGKTSCKSDLELNNGNYDQELSKEHDDFTKEIYEMISKSPEYPK
jgi:hypothetical protein